MTENNNKEADQPFEFYIKELDRVLAEMEKGGISQLDSMIENFEYGSRLIEKCNKILKEAEMRVQKISKGMDCFVPRNDENSIIKENRDENS